MHQSRTLKSMRVIYASALGYSSRNVKGLVVRQFGTAFALTITHGARGIVFFLYRLYDSLACDQQLFAGYCFILKRFYR